MPRTEEIAKEEVTEVAVVVAPGGAMAAAALGVTAVVAVDMEVTGVHPRTEASVVVAVMTDMMAVVAAAALVIVAAVAAADVTVIMAVATVVVVVMAVVDDTVMPVLRVVPRQWMTSVKLQKRSAPVDRD